jgi:hypothetical protein
MSQAPDAIPTNETCPAELPNFCAQRHWSIFWIMIICSLTVVTGRVLTVVNHDAKGDSPFFSANDRSRWCTIRSLGDSGTYEIDGVTREGQAIDWQTIDQVRHVGKDDRFHFYSSKPTLLPTMLAGVYTAVKRLTGKNISDDTMLVVRLMLLLVSALPWAVYLYFVAKMINTVPVRDWARYYVLACAGFGTYLSTFSNTLNNHLPAAISVMIALYCVAGIWRKENSHWSHFFWCGLFAAFAAANELPALSFLAFVGLLCVIKSFRKTTFAFAPAVLLVAAGFFGTNFLAHGQWRPAYSHRGDGEVLAVVTGDFRDALDQERLPVEIREAAEQHFEFKFPIVVQGAWPSTSKEERRWVVRDQVSTTQFSVVGKGGTEFEIRAWDNWYDYPESYWLTTNAENKSAVDRGQESLDLYAFHVLFGHHGVFSLTPIWLLSFAGMIALMFGAKMAGRFQMRWLGWMGVSISLVVIGFYLSRPAMDRNYGGVTSALRWLFWLAPIWLVSMLPVVDWLAKTKSGQALCFLLLFLSAVSACYSMNNPWAQPWLYEIWDLTGLRK